MIGPAQSIVRVTPPNLQSANPMQVALIYTLIVRNLEVHR